MLAGPSWQPGEKEGWLSWLAGVGWRLEELGELLGYCEFLGDDSDDRWNRLTPEVQGIAVHAGIIRNLARDLHQRVEQDDEWFNVARERRHIERLLANLLLLHMPALRTGALTSAGNQRRRWRQGNPDLKLCERYEQLERTCPNLGKRARAKQVAKEVLGHEKSYKTVERALRDRLIVLPSQENSS